MYNRFNEANENSYRPIPIKNDQKLTPPNRCSRVTKSNDMNNKKLYIIDTYSVRFCVMLDYIDSNNKKHYKVEPLFYLASYYTDKQLIDILTRSITSLTVIHCDHNLVFIDYSSALEKANEMNN